MDLLGITGSDGFLRVSGTGAAGDGRFSVPVAGGFDLDGDGIAAGALDVGNVVIISGALLPK